jgi:hypothetical protein
MKNRYGIQITDIAIGLMRREVIFGSAFLPGFFSSCIPALMCIPELSLSSDPVPVPVPVN